MTTLQGQECLDEIVPIGRLPEPLYCVFVLV